MNFFLSAGFGGLCAVIGAVVAYGAATLATRQKARADADLRRQAEVGRAWDRFVWIMDHRDEFNPVLTADLLNLLVTTGERLGDADLVAIGRRIGAELFREGRTPFLPASTTPPDQADTDQDDQEGE